MRAYAWVLDNKRWKPRTSTRSVGSAAGVQPDQQRFFSNPGFNAGVSHWSFPPINTVASHAWTHKGIVTRPSLQSHEVPVISKKTRFRIYVVVGLLVCMRCVWCACVVYGVRMCTSRCYNCTQMKGFKKNPLLTEFRKKKSPLLTLGICMRIGQWPGHWLVGPGTC